MRLPKVYVNGILIQAVNGVYKVEIKDNTSVVIADTSAINVIYNANGGMNAPIDVRTYANGDTAVVMSDIPSRKGYVFEGWGTSAESDYAQYKGGDGISVVAEDIVLYAVWEPLGYTIKYDANGGNGAMAPTSAVYGKEYTLSKNTFTKTGCQFAGWSYSADGEIAYTDGATVKNLTDAQNGEVTLYAVWKGAKTRIKFNFEGGSSGTASCEAVYGKILPSDRLIPPTRYGYTFAGYYTLPDKGGNLVYNADMSPGGDYAVNPWDSDADEFELYASWEPIKYTVAFVSGTKTLGTVSAVYGDVLKLPKWDTLGVSVPEGYSFCGWSVAAGSDTVYYRDGQEITSGLAGENSAEVVLYAVILKNESYTVTLPASGEGYKVYYNGAEVVSSKDISVNKGEDISFKICVDDGYSADKMTVSANGIMLGAVQINGNSYTYTVSRISADTNINIYHVKKKNSVLY
ncbi:MAG: InlB B-repeat-containing protein [Clostridiales bacterium]|nr:MAG: InlB B-repeat-containing protein [Clostridiales bacterium]